MTTTGGIKGLTGTSGAGALHTYTSFTRCCEGEQLLANIHDMMAIAPEMSIHDKNRVQGCKKNAVHNTAKAAVDTLAMVAKH